MNDVAFKILSQRKLTQNVYELKLRGDCAAITRPGQFVNLRLDGLYLRRPISVCDLEGETLTLIYKRVGKGTVQLSDMQPGQTVPAGASGTKRFRETVGSSSGRGAGSAGY